MAARNGEMFFTRVDLDTPVLFHSPPPGLAGAVIQVPERVREVVLALNGKQLTLREAIARIKAVTDSTAVVEALGSVITLELRVGHATHSFWLIKYRPA